MTSPGLISRSSSLVPVHRRGLRRVDIVPTIVFHPDLSLFFADGQNDAVQDVPGLDSGRQPGFQPVILELLPLLLEFLVRQEVRSCLCASRGVCPGRGVRRTRASSAKLLVGRDSWSCRLSTRRGRARPRRSHRRYTCRISSKKIGAEIRILAAQGKDVERLFFGLFGLGLGMISLLRPCG